MPADWDFLVTLHERLRPLDDPVEILDVAVRLIGGHFQASRVDYAQIEGDEFVIRGSYAPAALPFANRGPVGRFGQAIVDAWRRGDTVVVSDTAADPRLTESESAALVTSGIAALLAVPLISEGRWLATLAIHSATPRSWTHDQIALTEMTAERIWAAGERARLHDGVRRQTFLRQVNDAIREFGEPARILEEGCRLLGTQLGVNRVVYGEIDGDICTVVCDYVDGLPPMAGRFRWTDLGGGRTAEILQGSTLFANDTATEPHTPAERDALQAAGIAAYVCPVLVKDGRLVGVFAIHSREPRVWTPEERALVADVADRMWATFEHRKAEGELRANEERLQFLLQLNDALRGLNNPRDMQDTAARLLGHYLHAARASYSEFEGDDYTVQGEYTDSVAQLTGRRLRVAMGEELLRALRRGETIVVNDAHSDPRVGAGNRTLLEQRQIRAWIGVPLFRGGRIIAAFGVNDVAPRVWTASEIALVRDVAERTWDAVERSRAEAALRAQQQRLLLALEASGGGSWSWVAASNQLDWDERFRPLYGLSPDEPATVETWLARVHEEDRPRLLALRKEMLRSRTKDSFESTYRIVRPDGTVTWIQSRGRADRDAEGNVIRLTGLDLDFNEHRRREEARRARREEEHDRALRTLLETAAEGIVSVDAEGVIVTANHAFEAMFGWTAGGLVGEHIERLMPTAFRDGNERRGGVHSVGVRQDGSTFPLEISVNHVPTPGGRRVFAFVTDITARQRAAAALQERTAELEYRTMQLSRMASDLTLAEQHAREQIARTLHDGLQQMLVIALLNLDLHLKHDSESGVTPSELLSETKHQIEEAVAAARSLNFELYPPVLQRSGLPAALKWLANWTHDKYKLEVRVIVDPRADSARKDVRTLLFESVRELIFNAVKHAQADHVTLELALDDDDHLCITVSDQGIGFERTDLDGRSKAGQVGWGLFSIRERLTLLGGRFEIESASGKGTRVRLVAPRGAPHGAAAASTSVRVGGIAARAAGLPDALRILIVDDHAGVRSTLRHILNEQPQLSVVGDASNGFEAIAYAHTLRPDVILMDIAMPHMDGIEATVRIRAELPDIQILGLSLQPRSAAADAIQQAGATGFFVKGIDTERLIDHLLVVHGSRAGNGRHADASTRHARE